jgi:hypothetical protein
MTVSAGNVIPSSHFPGPKIPNEQISTIPLVEICNLEFLVLENGRSGIFGSGKWEEWEYYFLDMTFPAVISSSVLDCRAQKFALFATSRQCQIGGIH